MDLGFDWMIFLAWLAGQAAFQAVLCRAEWAMDALFGYVITNQKTPVSCPECSFTQAVT